MRFYCVGEVESKRKLEPREHAAVIGSKQIFNHSTY